MFTNISRQTPTLTLCPIVCDYSYRAEAVVASIDPIKLMAAIIQQKTEQNGIESKKRKLFYGNTVSAD